MKVVFLDKEHRYFYGDLDYLSVSKAFAKFKPEFKTDFISSRSALRDINPVEYKVVTSKYGYDNEFIIDILLKRVNYQEFIDKKKEILDSWEAARLRSTDIGTLFHSMMEEKDISSGMTINEYTNKEYPTITFEKEYPEFDNEAVMDDLSQIKDGYYPEFLVFNHKNRLAGQMDRLFIETIKDVRYVDIGDWKTDKAIEEIPDYFKRKKFLFYPLNHLNATNYNEYTMKISMYAYMMECFGFVPRNLGITHVKLEEDYSVRSSKVFRTKYLRQDVINLLDVLTVL